VTDDDRMAARMDGDYTPPIVAPAPENQPVPEWDPQTTLTRKA
jgi:hypothetical protein